MMLDDVDEIINIKDAHSYSALIKRPMLYYARIETLKPR